MNYSSISSPVCHVTASQLQASQERLVSVGWAKPTPATARTTSRSIRWTAAGELHRNDVRRTMGVLQTKMSEDDFLVLMGWLAGAYGRNGSLRAFDR